VIMPHHDTRIRSGDHVILFLSDRTRVAAVQRLFQPSRRLLRRADRH
jgi:trk system potassium uptake protein